MLYLSQRPVPGSVFAQHTGTSCSEIHGLSPLIYTTWVTRTLSPKHDLYNMHNIGIFVSMMHIHNKRYRSLRVRPAKMKTGLIGELLQSRMSGFVIVAPISRLLTKQVVCFVVQSEILVLFTMTASLVAIAPHDIHADPIDPLVSPRSCHVNVLTSLGAAVTTGVARVEWRPTLTAPTLQPAI